MDRAACHHPDPFTAVHSSWVGFHKRTLVQQVGNAGDGRYNASGTMPRYDRPNTDR